MARQDFTCREVEEIPVTLKPDSICTSTRQFLIVQTISYPPDYQRNLNVTTHSGTHPTDFSGNPCIVVTQYDSGRYRSLIFKILRASYATRPTIANSLSPSCRVVRNTSEMYLTILINYYLSNCKITKTCAGRTTSRARRYCCFRQRDVLQTVLLQFYSRPYYTIITIMTAKNNKKIHLYICNTAFDNPPSIDR